MTASQPLSSLNAHPLPVQGYCCNIIWCFTKVVNNILRVFSLTVSMSKPSTVNGFLLRECWSIVPRDSIWMYAALLTLFFLSTEGFPTCNRGFYTVLWWLYLITKLVRGLSVLLLFIILLRIHNMNSFRNGLNMILFLLQVGSFLSLAVRGCEFGVYG